LREFLRSKFLWHIDLPNSPHRGPILIAIVEAAIARGCRHYSESGELLATTLAVLECLEHEGFVTVEEPDIACG
jgi:hypothetical protein